MKVETKKAGPCTVNLTVRAAADEVAEIYGNVQKEFFRNAQLPGFRKGKAPAELVKQKFAAEIKSETQGACFRALYPKAIAEAKLEAVENDGVLEVSFSPETGMSFTTVVEVAPEVKLPKYEKLPIKRNEVTVTDGQVDEELERVRGMFAKFEDGKEGAVAADGDFVQFDYAGSLDGKPLAEVVPDEKAVCSAEGFWIQLEDGRFLPEILAAIKGMKVGDVKESVEVKFPEDVVPEALKGKTCSYRIALKALRPRVLPDDDELVKSARADSLDALKGMVRTRLERSAKQAETASRQDQAVELLLRKCDFEVPPAYVRNLMARKLDELAKRAEQMGVGADYVEKNRESILKNAEESATRDVRLFYVLKGIADAEKIEVDEKDPAKAGDARAQKALEWVIEHAK